MNIIAKIAMRIASEWASFVPGSFQDDSIYSEFEKWYYDKIDQLFNDVNSKISGFDLPFEFSIEYDEEFETSRDEFDDEQYDAVGMAMWSNQVDAHVVPIAIDPQRVYVEDGFEGQPTAEKEIKITLWHEVGHAIIGLFNDQCEYDVMGENGWTDEEEIAEEFGQAMGNLNGSKLGKWILDEKRNNWNNVYGDEQ